MFNLSLPTLAIIAALVAASYGGTYLKGHYDGTNSKQREWNAAIAANLEAAAKSRADVDRDIVLEPPARELCNDKWNRNPC